MPTMPLIQEFSSWNGTTPFWSNVSTQGRIAYVSPGEDEEGFLAYGYHTPTRQVVFVVRGANDAERSRFDQQMRQEGAEVTAGLPPFGVDSQSSDKPPGPPSSPTGIDLD